jgi:hypothetical protein
MSVPLMKKKTDELKEQMEQMAQMGGAGANPAGFAMMSGMMDGFVRDASSGVVGFKATDAGVSVDLGAQFKEGIGIRGLLLIQGQGRRPDGQPAQA